MLRCLFGKCSSDTYVVTQFPKKQSGKTDGLSNGVAKINQFPPETSVTANGHLPEERVHPQPEENISVSNETAKTVAPSPPKIEENIELKENNSAVLENISQNYDLDNKILDKHKDISVILKESPTAEQEQKNTAQVLDTVSVPEEEPLDRQEEVKAVESNKTKENRIKGHDLGAESQTPEPTTAEISQSVSKPQVAESVRESEAPKLVNESQTVVQSSVTSSNANDHYEALPVKEESTDKINLDKSNTITASKSEVTTSEIRENGITKEETKINKQNESIEVVVEHHDHYEALPAKEESTDEIKVVKNDTITASKSGVTAKENRIAKEEIDKQTESIEIVVEQNHEPVSTQEAPSDNITIDSSEKNKSKLKDKKKVTVKIEEKEKETPAEDKSTKKKSDAPEVDLSQPGKRRSGVVPLPVKYDENVTSTLPKYPKAPDDEELIKSALERNDFLNKIISGQRLDDVINSMYNKEIASKETIIKQGEKGSHMYISAKGKYQVVVKGKVVSEFDDVRVFGELAILYNAKRLATVKALTPGRIWVLDRSVYQQIMLRYNIKEQDEIMEFLMNNNKLNVVGKEALQEVANLLKTEFFLTGKQIVRQGDKGHQFYIIRAGTVTITKEGEGVVGELKKGDCFGELALLKEDCRQATVTANAPGVECLTLTRKEFIAHFGELEDLTDIKVRPQDSIKAAVAEHEDINLNDLKIIKTLGVGGFGRVELVQHTKKKDLVFALKYLKKIDIVLQHQEEHVYNEKNIQMASKSPFIVRLYRTYKDSKYIYLLMESCLGGDLWSLLQKQKVRRFDEKEARFIAGCVLEAFEYLHSRGIIYRDLKPENLLIASNGYIKLTDFGFAKKISSRGRTFTFAGTPEYVAPEIVLNRGHDRAVDYWAFGAFIFELLTGRTPFRTDDSSHMKTYNKILNGIDNIQFPSYVNLKARHIIEKLCRPIPSERLGMQRGGIKDIKSHKWFLGIDWVKFAKCEIPSPYKPKLRGPVDTQHFDQFKKDTDIPPDEISGWDEKF